MFAAGTSLRPQIFPFRADGALLDSPTTVPTQLDLPATPRPCSVGDRSRVSRVVAPIPARDPPPASIITDPVEPQRVLLTDDAVLHGTPQPRARPPTKPPRLVRSSDAHGRRGQGLVFVDPGEHSWLFRLREANLMRRRASVEYRSMSCRFDPAAEVPLEVFKEKGTLVEPP